MRWITLFSLVLVLSVRLALAGGQQAKRERAAGAERKGPDSHSPRSQPSPEDRFKSAVDSVVLVEFTIKIDMSEMTGQLEPRPFKRSVYGIVLDRNGYILIAGDYGLGDMMVVEGMEQKVSTPEAINVRGPRSEKPLPARFVKRDTLRNLATIQVSAGADTLTPIDRRTARMPRAAEAVAVIVGHQPELFWSRAEPGPDENRNLVKEKLGQQVIAPDGATVFPLPPRRRWQIRSEGLPVLSEQGEFLGIITYVKLAQPEKVRRPGFGRYAVMPAEYFPVIKPHSGTREPGG